MTDEICVEIEPMTVEAFAPFGWLIDAPERPSDHRPLVPARFECDGRTTVSTIWQPYAEASFSRLERHFGVTQTFFQLSGPSAAVCVAPPTDPDREDAIPDPGEVRAFLIDPDQGFTFARGTWHSLDRYVLAPPGATFVILNVDPNPTQIVDFTDGMSFRHENLDAGPSPRRTALAGEFGLRFRLSVSEPSG